MARKSKRKNIPLEDESFEEDGNIDDDESDLQSAQPEITRARKRWFTRSPKCMFFTIIGLFVVVFSTLMVVERLGKPIIFPGRLGQLLAPPTDGPSAMPSLIPSQHPTLIPTTTPSLTPTLKPSVPPTVLSSVVPSASMIPSQDPTSKPSLLPTAAPTDSPTSVPSLGPTSAPTSIPTLKPSLHPTSTPSLSPTVAPTLIPSTPPTSSSQPSLSPSVTYEAFVESISLQVSGDIPQFFIKNTPQAQAREWLLRTNRRMERNEVVIKHLYILAVFYYSMNGNNWKSNDNFLLPDVSECEWEGVRCNLKDHLVVISFGEYILKE